MSDGTTRTPGAGIRGLAVGAAILASASALVVCFSCGDEGAPAAGPAPPIVTTQGGIEMVSLPGGGFRMGSDTADQVDETPHRVYVGPFAIDRYEVTQQAYERLMGKNPSRWKAPRNPAEQIRWAEAVAYCNARSRSEGLRPCYDLRTWACDFDADGYRLPTEAEWEYACRAGTTTRYFFGDNRAKLGLYGWYKLNCPMKPRAVGLKRPNPWGLYDMYGNVWEWCNDFYREDAYRAGPEKNPRGPTSGRTRVLRGGCWNSRPGYCRSAYRFDENPGYTDVCFGADTHGFVGFRCVRPQKAGGT